MIKLQKHKMTTIYSTAKSWLSYSVNIATLSMCQIVWQFSRFWNLQNCCWNWWIWQPCAKCVIKRIYERFICIINLTFTPNKNQEFWHRQTKSVSVCCDWWVVCFCVYIMCTCNYVIIILILIIIDIVSACDLHSATELLLFHEWYFFAECKNVYHIFSFFQSMLKQKICSWLANLWFHVCIGLISLVLSKRMQPH